LGPVSAVWAESAQLGGLEIDVEDTALVGLRFASGAIGSVSLDYVERPAAHWLRLVGRRGRITWDNADGVAHLFDAGGERCASSSLPRGFARNALFLEEMRHFLRCLEGQARSACTLDDGAEALRLALAARQSAQTGMRVHV
jgi:predicted dehydrogenase